MRDLLVCLSSYSWIRGTWVHRFMLSYLAIFLDFSLIGMLQNQAIAAQVVEDNEKVYPLSLLISLSLIPLVKVILPASSKQPFCLFGTVRFYMTSLSTAITSSTLTWGLTLAFT